MSKHIIVPGAPVLEKIATYTRQHTDQYKVDAVCMHCKMRGLLWFDRHYKIEKHACPDCKNISLRVLNLSVFQFKEI